MLRADPFNKPVFAPCVKACDAFLFSHPLTLNLWPQCEHSHSALRTPSLIHFIASGGWSQLINYIPSQLSVIFIFMSQKHVARGRICTLKFNVIVSILLNMLLHRFIHMVSYIDADTPPKLVSSDSPQYLGKLVCL
jgi:hypothetical protein